MKQQPIAWMRKWAHENEKEYRVKSPTTGKMVLHHKFKYLPVTLHKCLIDDIPLFTKKTNETK